MMSPSGNTAEPYFVGPDDTTNTDAPTASNNARRDDVRLPDPMRSQHTNPSRCSRLREGFSSAASASLIFVTPPCGTWPMPTRPPQ